MTYYKVISKYYNDLLISKFKSQKTRKLVAKKYFWLTLKRDITLYVKKYNVFLACKIVKHKPYKDLQSLLISTNS